MLRLSGEAMAAFSRAAQRALAASLTAWWRERFPWFVALAGEDVEATALDVITEAMAHGYARRREIMRYSVGYLYFGGRFADSPLHANLLARCRWYEAVAPSVRLARILEHVDMLVWNRTFSGEHGPLLDLPRVVAGPAGPLSPASLADVLQGVPRRRLAHLDRGPEVLARYTEQVRTALAASEVPAAWHLRGAILGVFLGWNWARSPALAWLTGAVRGDRTSEITARLYGNDRA